MSTAAQKVAVSGDPSLFAKSVEAGAQAVAAMPAADVRRVGMLYNYASAVMAQAVDTEVTDAELFREAERAYRAALALLDPDHPDNPRIESTIADLLYHRYEQCHDLGALSDSLDLAVKAVRETPRDHHWWPLRAFALARSAKALATFGGPHADELRQQAITYYRAVGAHPAATAQYRMMCERQQATMLAEADPATVLDALERVVTAIPATVSRALPRLQRMTAVAQLDGLADRVTDAGRRSDGWTGHWSCSNNAGPYCSATRGESVAAGRSWSRSSRSSPEKLSQLEKDLADADLYSDLMFSIEIGYEGETSTTTRWDPRPQAVQRIRQLAARRDSLIEAARSVRGWRTC